MSDDSLDNLQDSEPRDSRLESFLRGAGGILAADKQWSPETRVKLRALADRLKLPADVFQKALDELSNPTRAVPQSRWEVAYIKYLELQFQKLPGRILSLPQERKALNYGQRKFQLSIENCEHWLSQTAQRMEIARISDSDAIAHAQAEVSRLTSGQFKFDDSLEEEVVTAVRRWGIEPKQARRLLESQLAANRSKLRKKKLRLLTTQVGSVALGVFLIVVMFVLARVLLPQLDSAQDKAAGVPNAAPKTEVPPKTIVGVPVFPQWWTEAARGLILDQMQAPEMAVIVLKLGADDAKVRTVGYSDLVENAVKVDANNFLSAPESSRWMRQPLMQQAIVDWFVNEPSPQASYDLVKLLKIQRSQLSDVQQTDSIQSMLFRFIELTSVNTILTRMEVEAIARPENSGLRTAIESQLPDIAVGSADIKDVSAWLKSSQRSMVIGSSNVLCRRLKGRWLAARGTSFSAKEIDQIERECKLVLASLRTVSEEAIRTRISLEFLASVAGLDIRLGNAFLPEMSQLVIDAAPSDLGTVTELCYWFGESSALGTPLFSLLRGRAPSGQFSPSGVSLVDFLALQRLLETAADANVVGAHLRLAFLRQEVDDANALLGSGSAWTRKDWAKLLGAVSLSIALLDSRLDYRKFDQLVLERQNDFRADTREGDGLPVEIGLQQRLVPTDQWVQETLQSLAQVKDDVRQYEVVVNRVANLHQEGLFLSQRQWASFVAVLGEDLSADKQVSWQLVFPTLINQVDFVLALADYVQVADDSKVKRLSQLAIETRKSTQANRGIDFQLDSESLKIRALDQLQTLALRQTNENRNVTSALNLSPAMGVEVRRCFGQAIVDRMKIYSSSDDLLPSGAEDIDDLMVDLIRRMDDQSVRAFNFPLDSNLFRSELTNVLLLHAQWSQKVAKRYGVALVADLDSSNSEIAADEASLRRLKVAEFALLQTLDAALAQGESVVRVQALGVQAIADDTLKDGALKDDTLKDGALGNEH